MRQEHVRVCLGHPNLRIWSLGSHLPKLKETVAADISDYDTDECSNKSTYLGRPWGSLYCWIAEQSTQSTCWWSWSCLIAIQSKWPTHVTCCAWARNAPQRPTTNKRRISAFERHGTSYHGIWQKKAVQPATDPGWYRAIQRIPNAKVKTSHLKIIYWSPI